MKKAVLTLVCILLVFVELNGQNKTIISGIIKDDKGKPLPYVNVFLLNTADGTMSDDDGSFSFKTSQRGKVTLIFA